MALDALTWFALSVRILTPILLAVVAFLYIKMVRKIRRYMPDIELRKLFLSQLRYFAFFAGVIGFVVTFWLLQWMTTWKIIALPISLETFGVIGAFVNVLYIVAMIPILRGYSRFSQVIPAYALEKLASPLSVLTNELGANYANPFELCEKMDKLLGSGAEVIVHQAWFSLGHAALGGVVVKNPNKKGHALKELAKTSHLWPMGASYTIEDEHVPRIRVTVKDPPIKNTKGSAKRMISSFWAGAFSKYYEKELTAKDHQYNPETDELTVIISA